MDPAAARSYREAYYKYGFREQMWKANFRRLQRSDPDLFAAASGG
jgi:L-fuculose-phosphate aldolase